MKMKEIKILGTGCPKCQKLAEVVESVAREMNIDYKLEKVTDINKIMNFGIMITPALVVEGEIKIAGKIPKTDDIKKMLS